MKNPEFIYLEPVCQNKECEDCGNDERLWSYDDPWGGNVCEGCSEELPKATIYLLNVNGSKEIILTSIPIKRLNYLEGVEKLSKKVLPVLERILEKEKVTSQFVDFLRNEEL